MNFTTRHYITHFQPVPLPTTGTKKLSFYTQKKGVSEKYFFGFQDKEFSSEHIKNLVDINELIPLMEKIEISSSKSLYVNSKGIVWLAHKDNADRDKNQVAMLDPMLA